MPKAIFQKKICLNNQSLFSGEISKYFKISSAEILPSLLSVKWMGIGNQYKYIYPAIKWVMSRERGLICIIYADSDNSDQLAHLHSMLEAVVARL